MEYGRSEPPAVRICIIAIAVTFLAIFVALPLVVVFIEALSKGVLAYLAALSDPEALATIRLTLVVAAISVGINLLFGLTAAWVITKTLEVANRIVVMDKGRIEQVGSPGEVYDRPATAFVYGFIGESIALPVHVENGAVRLNGQALELAAAEAATGSSTLFVRRHAMQVGPAGSGLLEGKVSEIRTFGPIQRAEVALVASRVVIEIDTPRDRDLRIGEIIGLKPRRYRIFTA